MRLRFIFVAYILSMYPDDIYPWYSRNIMPVYYRDGYLRKGLMSVNSTRARMRNMMNYSSYRLPALGLSPEARYNLYKKRARIYP